MSAKAETLFETFSTVLFTRAHQAGVFLLPHPEIIGAVQGRQPFTPEALTSTLIIAHLTSIAEALTSRKENPTLPLDQLLYDERRKKRPFADIYQGESVYLLFRTVLGVSDEHRVINDLNHFTVRSFITDLGLEWEERSRNHIHIICSGQETKDILTPDGRVITSIKLHIL